MGYKGTIGKTNYTLGEISPRAFGRFDQDKPIYRDGAAIINNFLVSQAGSLVFRPGTQYVATTKNSANEVRLARFTYSISQEYVMEIGNLYIRFYANTGSVIVGSAPAWQTSTGYFVGNYVTEGGQIYYCQIAHTSGTFATDLAAGDWVLQTVLEIPTIFNQADIFNLQMAQKADVMYIVNPNYFPQKLIRLSATSFTISNVPFFRGPFLDTNITATTITPSSDTGSTTLTASTAIFLAGHVGSLWRVHNGVVLITGFTSTTVLVGTVQNELNVPAVPVAWGIGQTYNIGDYVQNSGTTYRCLIGNTTDSSSSFATDLAANYWIAVSGSTGNLGTGPGATTDWAEGAFSTVRGFPTAVTFHEGRLVYGGTSYNPQTMWASSVDAYDDFDTGASLDSDSWTYEIANEQSNAILWLASDTALQIGTSGGTISAADGNSQTGITPTSPPDINFNDVYGVMYTQPVKLAGYVFFLQANGFNLRQLTYDLVTSKYKSGNQMVLSDHILRDGLGAVQMAAQSSPFDRIWVVRADGQIAVLTRDPDQQVTGWSRIIGGQSDIQLTCTGYNGTFESIAILPIPGQDDQIWVVARRSIGGVMYRFIEVFTAEIPNYYWNPTMMDASLTYDSPITITAIDLTQTPPLVTAPGHGLSNGNQIKLDGLLGAVQLNGGIFHAYNVTTNTFRLGA